MSDTATADPFESPEQLEATVEEPVERVPLGDFVDPRSIVATSDPDLQDEQQAVFDSIEAPEGAEQGEAIEPVTEFDPPEGEPEPEPEA